MKTSGTFFLRARPYATVLCSPTEGEVKGWLLPIGERTAGGGTLSLTAMWRGQAADLFFIQHNALKAGDCLQLELDQLHARENELRANVVRAQIAPARWALKRQADGSARLLHSQTRRLRGRLIP